MTIFAEQRQEKIMELLREYNKVDVSSLTTVLSVSEATIRRDLEKLEKAGVLHRTHGGAILVNEDIQFLKQKEENDDPRAREIQDIGSAASKFLVDGEVIAIGSGALGLSLARNINPDLSCTVVTNDVMIMSVLLNYDDIDVIMIGGHVKKKKKNYMFTAGELTMRMLSEFHVNKAFLSVDGISIQDGVTINDYEYALIWKELKGISDEIIIMAAADAFNRSDFIKLMPLDEVDRVISSVKLEDKYKKYLFENGISIHISHEI